MVAGRVLIDGYGGEGQCPINEISARNRWPPSQKDWWKMNEQRDQFTKCEWSPGKSMRNGEAH